MRPTQKHRLAIWENMLGTVWAANDAGEARYFDYRWDDAVAFSGALEDGRDPRTYRTDRAYPWPRPGKGDPALWVKRS